MDKIFIIIGIIILILLVLVITFIFVRIFLYNAKKNDITQKLYNTILEVFSDNKNKSFKRGKISSILKEEKNNPNYNYILETEHEIYYFKTVFNTYYDELLIRSKSEIYLTKGLFSKNKKVLTDVISFVNEEYKSENKAIFKYVIFYPTLKQKISITNNLIYNFIYADEPLFGTHFATIDELKERV